MLKGVKAAAAVSGEDVHSWAAVRASVVSAGRVPVISRDKQLEHGDDDVGWPRHGSTRKAGLVIAAGGRPTGRVAPRDLAQRRRPRSRALRRALFDHFGRVEGSEGDRTPVSRHRE